MKKLSLILLALMTIKYAVAADHFPAITKQWLRAAPPNATMMAAYGQLHNDSNDPKILIGAYSPDFAMAEIHRTIISDGIATMKHQPELNIDVNDSIDFTPGGLHIMLMHPTKPINVGDSIKICLVYQQGKKEIVQHIIFPVINK